MGERKHTYQFSDPDYAKACERALARLRTEVYVYHDQNTPDIDDPDGVVTAAIKRLTDLYWIAQGKRR